MEWFSPGALEGGGRSKSPSPEPGWRGRSWALLGVPGWRGRGLGRSGINPFRAAGFGDCGLGLGEAGMSASEVSLSQPGSGHARLSLVCLREVCGCLVFASVSGCPLTLVSMDTGSRGGLLLLQSESGGESVLRADRRGTGVNATAGLPGAGRGCLEGD